MAEGDGDLEFDEDFTDPGGADDDDQGNTQDRRADNQDGEDVDRTGDEGDDEQIDAQNQDRQQPQDQRTPSRRDRRIDTLIESSRQKDTQIAQLNQRLDALLTTRSQPQGETREQRDARRQQMSPEDRMYDVLSEHTEAWGREKHMLTLGMADQMDKAAFDAKCSVDKRYAKRQAAVETKLTELRSNNQSAPREAVLRWVIGDEALKAAQSKEAQVQRQEAGRRVRRQQARPASNGSDVQADRGRQTSRARRLENVQI